MSLFPDAGRSRTRRIDGRLFKLPDHVYKECLRYGVKSGEIQYHKDRWNTLGIKSSAAIAAMRALEDKKKEEERAVKKMRGIGSDVKGQTGADLLTFVVIIFFLGLISIIAVFIWQGINDGIQSTSSLPTESKTASSDATTNIPQGLDTGIIVALGILYAGLYITTRNIGTDPMFFWINLGLIAIVLGFAAILGNVFQGTNISSLATARASVPAVVYIGNHLLEFGIGAAAVVTIGLFSKPQ